MRGRVRIQFVDEHGTHEAGVDGGGLFKDFMEGLVKEGFSPATYVLSPLWVMIWQLMQCSCTYGVLVSGRVLRWVTFVEAGDRHRGRGSGRGD